MAAVNIYSVQAVPEEDYVDLYELEILPGVRCSQVETAFVCYITENVEPVGWQAIWRSTPKFSGLASAYDFLVEVADVSQSKLEARIIIIKPLPKFDELLNSEETPEDVQKKYAEGTSCMVPLLELFAVFDESTNGEFERTAEVIEHVRFFYKNLWRPWDCDDEEDCVFVDHYLESRLKLCYDVIDNKIPSDIVDKMQWLLNEAWRNHDKLEKLEGEMNASDSEVELAEKDVLKCAELRMKQEELKRELLLLENPALRALMIQKELSIQPLSRGRRADGEVVLHVVAEKLLAEMIQGLPPMTVIEHHTSFQAAVGSVYEGDTIWIYPGMYVCEALGWLEDSVEIEGKGCDCRDVYLKAKGSSDIFVNCNAAHIRFKNLTIAADIQQHCALMVHRGQTVLEDCCLINGKLGVCANLTAEVILRQCRLLEAQICGVSVHSMASLCVEGSKIYCDNIGVAVEYEDDKKSNRFVTVMDSVIHGSPLNCGIVFHPTNQALQDLTCSVLKTLPQPELRFSRVQVESNLITTAEEEFQVCLVS